MKTFYLCFFVLLSTAIFAQDFNSKWSNGFKVESDDGNFKLKFGGRIMVDYAFFSQADGLEMEFGELNSGAEFRRARFFNSGLIYNKIKYKLQLDFAGGSASFKDAFIEVPKIAVLGDLRIGHFKQPFRFQALTSSKYMTFMERTGQIPFNQERNTGVMIKNESSDKSFGWQLGYFYNANSQGKHSTSTEGYNLTARLSYMPIMNKENNTYLLIASALNYKTPDAEEYNVSVRPAAHLAPKYIGTGTISDVESVTMFNVETALVLNSLYFEAAYLSAGVDAVTTEQLSTYYAQATYFLTGESRTIKSHYDGLNRVKPKKNFGSEDGSGAWEVGLRYAMTNLNDDQVMGGEMSEIVLGVNWYLNPATRFMFNYVNADVKDVDNASIFQFRFQIDF